MDENVNQYDLLKDPGKILYCRVKINGVDVNPVKKDKIKLSTSKPIQQATPPMGAVPVVPTEKESYEQLLDISQYKGENLLTGVRVSWGATGDFRMTLSFEDKWAWLIDQILFSRPRGPDNNCEVELGWELPSALTAGDNKGKTRYTKTFKGTFVTVSFSPNQEHVSYDVTYFVNPGRASTVSGDGFISVNTCLPAWEYSREWEVKVSNMDKGRANVHYHGLFFQPVDINYKVEIERSYPGGCPFNLDMLQGVDKAGVVSQEIKYKPYDFRKTPVLFGLSLFPEVRDFRREYWDYATVTCDFVPKDNSIKHGVLDSFTKKHVFPLENTRLNLTWNNPISPPSMYKEIPAWVPKNNDYKDAIAVKFSDYINRAAYRIFYSNRTANKYQSFVVAAKYAKNMYNVTPFTYIGKQVITPNWKLNHDIIRKFIVTITYPEPIKKYIINEKEKYKKILGVETTDKIIENDTIYYFPSPIKQTTGKFKFEKSKKTILDFLLPFVEYYGLKLDVEGISPLHEIFDVYEKRVEKLPDADSPIVKKTHLDFKGKPYRHPYVSKELRQLEEDFNLDSSGLNEGECIGKRFPVLQSSLLEEDLKSYLSNGGVVNAVPGKLIDWSSIIIEKGSFRKSVFEDLEPYVVQSDMQCGIQLFPRQGTKQLSSIDIVIQGVNATPLTSLKLNRVNEATVSPVFVLSNDTVQYPSKQKNAVKTTGTSFILRTIQELIDDNLVAKVIKKKDGERIIDNTVGISVDGETIRVKYQGLSGSERMRNQVTVSRSYSNKDYGNTLIDARITNSELLLRTLTSDVQTMEVSPDGEVLSKPMNLAQALGERASVIGDGVKIFTGDPKPERDIVNNLRRLQSDSEEKDDAKHLSLTASNVANIRTYTQPGWQATLVLVGDPKIEPLELVKFTYYRRDLTRLYISGVYQVLGITHEVRGGAFRTNLDLIKMYSTVGDLELSGIDILEGIKPDGTLNNEDIKETEED